jgi:orotate phosphoribosyltransferase
MRRVDERGQLFDLVRRKALIRGTFRLSSGDVSDHYFDCKLVTLDPEGMYLIAGVILDLLERERIEAGAIGGPTIGADPIATAVAMRSRERGRPLPAFLVRAGAKDHGTGRVLENPPPAGTSIVLVEDVVTTGRSTLKAIQACEQQGLQISAVVCIVDREQGGAEALASYRFLPLFRGSDLLGSGSK